MQVCMHACARTHTHTHKHTHTHICTPGSDRVTRRKPLSFDVTGRLPCPVAFLPPTSCEKHCVCVYVCVCVCACVCVCVCLCVPFAVYMHGFKFVCARACVRVCELLLAYLSLYCKAAFYYGTNTHTHTHKPCSVHPLTVIHPHPNHIHTNWARTTYFHRVRPSTEISLPNLLYTVHLRQFWPNTHTHTHTHARAHTHTHTHTHARTHTHTT